jgi:hypothetical protein
MRTSLLNLRVVACALPSYVYYMFLVAKIKGILSYRVDKLFEVKAPVTLTFDPVTSKSIGVIY